MTNWTQPHTSEAVITTIGIIYILSALITIPLHIVCSWLMWKDKEMRNSTYQFIINLSIADVLELITIGFYAGSILVFRLPQNEYIERVMSFWLLTAWYANCVLFAFIAFSRWVAITRTHLVKRIFTRRNLRIMHTVPWLIICVFYFFTCVLYPAPTFLFFTEIFTWGFDMTLPFGRYLHWHNFTFNTSCAIVETAFNVMSLNWVRKTRLTIQNLQTAENHRRETKLLIQCFIIGCVFSAVSCTFTVVFAAGVESVGGFLFMQFIWSLNHTINPIVYLSVNNKLRAALIRLVTCGKFGKYQSKVKSIAMPTVNVVPTALTGANTATPKASTAWH